MPKKTPDYSKSLIYKLVSNDTDIKNVYIGSTTNFRLRKYQHKNACNNENAVGYNTPIYNFIRDNGGFENWSMILIDYTPCNTKLELLKIEREYIEKIDSELLLNKDIPSRTNKEWLEDNKEYHYNKNKEYYHNNKEKINEKGKCDICGFIGLKKKLKRHQQSKKCLSCR